MKTKDNVQKTILKSLAVVTSLVLLSITVNAQVFWRTVLENNSLNHIAMAMIETKATTSTANSVVVSSAEAVKLAEYSTIESENPLNLEDWMTSEDAFKTNTFSFETEKEFALELESWMSDETVFYNTAVIAMYTETESEAGLELEGWMFDENFGKKAKSTLKVSEEVFQLEKDNKLQLESWMVNSSLWK